MAEMSSVGTSLKAVVADYAEHATLGDLAAEARAGKGTGIDALAPAFDIMPTGAILIGRRNDPER